jgi:uncharacterized membrane protein YfbV (UPF0208 family)
MEISASHPNLAKHPWVWLHLLSLDAPLVAVLWQLLFVETLHAHLAPVVTVLMALVIWLVYVADRILDSFQPNECTEEAMRHRFYREHRTAFLPPFFAILLVTGWMSYADLGERMRRDGLLLALAVSAYFGVVHMLKSKARGWFPKEIVVAILFAAGTFMPVGIRSRGLQVSFLLPFALFILVLWMNTLLIEYSEWMTLREGDADRPHESTIKAGRHLAAFSIGIAALALCAMGSHTFTSARPILLAEALSALALGALGLYWRGISSYVVRIAADVTLLTPALLLVVLGK